MSRSTVLNTVRDMTLMPAQMSLSCQCRKGFTKAPTAAPIITVTAPASATKRSRSPLSDPNNISLPHITSGAAAHKPMTSGIRRRLPASTAKPNSKIARPDVHKVMIHPNSAPTRSWATWSKLHRVQDTCRKSAACHGLSRMHTGRIHRSLLARVYSERLALTLGHGLSELEPECGKSEKPESKQERIERGTIDLFFFVTGVTGHILHK